MREYNEYVDFRKNNLQNKDKGVNDTNLERQNKEPLTKDQQDNIVNDIKGKAKDISDNKVE